MREDGMKDRPGTRTHTRLVKPASAPDYSQMRSDGLFPKQRYLHREALLAGLQGDFVAFQGRCTASHTVLCNVPRLSSP